MTTEATERDLVTEVEELLAKATPGRWFWTVNLKAKQISLQSQDGPRQYVMDFVRYGMNGAQPRFNVEGLMRDAQDCAVIVESREHHAAWYQTLDHPDANLIERAPELLRRLVEEVKRLALTEQEVKLLTDYHYYEAEKAVTRRGDKAQQQVHLERLATLRSTT